MQRIDIPAKVRGKHAFVADMELPGMVYGRVVRPPTKMATLVSAETRGAAQLPGVLAVVRDGSFLGVVAQREEQAVAAANYLRTATTWQADATLPDDNTIFDRLRQGATESFLVVDGAPTAEPIPPLTPPPNAAQTLEATYYRPFTMHGALGPSAALAEVVGDQLTVWTHSQGVYPLRGALAQVLGKDEATIRLIHVEGPGCYGHNGADDVVLDAALLAGAVPNRPVLVQWSREDEHRWEPFGPAMVCRSLPASTPKAMWLTGTTMCGVTHILVVLVHVRMDRRCWRRSIWRVHCPLRLHAPAKERIPAAIATPIRSTTSDRGASSNILYPIARCAPRRCAVWGRLPTSSPSSHLWMNWPRQRASIRSVFACVIWPIPAGAPSSRPSCKRPIGRAGVTPGTDRVLPSLSIRTRRPMPRWWPM